MKQRLSHALKETYEQIKLDDAQYQALSSKLNQEPNSAHTMPAPWFKCFRREIIAASFIIGLGLIFITHSLKEHEATELAQAITSEATKNHLNLKPLEIESAEVTKVLSYFNKLEFKPLKFSRVLKGKGHVLLGGRYCTILGVDAAQLRYKSKEGTIISLYQGTLSASKLKHIPDVSQNQAPWVRVAKGMQTKIWQEQGIVFVEVKN